MNNSEFNHSTATPQVNRSFQELFYIPRPQIVSAGITVYTIALNDWRIPIAIPFNDIQRLYCKVTSYDWQLVNGVPADSAKILATANRFVDGGAK